MDKTPDLEYINTGLFTRFMPNTPAGEDAWRVMAKEDGCAAVFTTHAKTVIARLRRAGYKVARAKKPAPVTAQEVTDLFIELGVEP